MALKTFVKINSVNNLSDARYCAGMHVDVIGFNINTGDDNAVNEQQFSEITSWVSGVEYAAEVTDASLINLEKFNVTYLESDNLNNLLNRGDKVKTILRTTLKDLNREMPAEIDIILLTGEGKLSEEDLSLLKSKSSTMNIILGYGLDATNIDEILEKTCVYGIALTAGNEIRPGYKDYDELAEILEVLEIDEWA